MKSKSLLTTTALAGLFLAGPTFAQTTSSEPVTQAQLDVLNKRIEQLEKLLADKNSATTDATQTAPATEPKATKAEIDAVAARVDKLETPTAIKIGALTIKPYGYIKLDAFYDSQKAAPTASGSATGDYSLYALAQTAGKNDSQLDFSARDSRFGFDFDLPEEHGITTTAKFENDFFANGAETAYSVRVRLAYVDLAFKNGLSVRAGQDWDAFFYVTPITVDAGFLGDAGYLYSRRAQIKLTEVAPISDTSKLTAKIALARTASGDLDGLGQDDGLDSAKPTIEGLLAFDTQILSSKPTKISLGGQISTETLDATGNPDAKDYDSHLIVAGLLFPIVEQFAVQGNLWSGTNLDGWLGGIGQGINTTLKRSVDAKGGWIQAIFNPTPLWNVNLGYGVDNPDDDDLNVGNRTRNTRLFANAFYKLTKSVTLSAEYSVITTNYEGGDDEKDNRIQFATKWQF